MKTLILAATLLLIGGVTTAQIFKDKEMRPTQWWLGLKFGGNSTNPSIVNSFNIYSDSEDFGLKDYENDSRKYGYQIGIVGTFDFWQIVALSFQPSAKVYNYGYNYQLQWLDSNEAVALRSEYEHDMSMLYIDMPLFVKLEWKFGGSASSGKVKATKRGVKTTGAITPFIQGGIFYSTLLSANKKIDYKLKEYDIQIEEEVFYTGVKNNYLVSQWGFAFGGGCYYDFESVRVGFDVNYRIGRNNITNQSTRYDDERLLTQYFDVNDDLKLLNWEAQLHVVFPFKFVYSGNFKAF